jgi:hypothetical protein
MAQRRMRLPTWEIRDASRKGLEKTYAKKEREKEKPEAQ